MTYPRKPLQQVALILTRAHHACTIGRVDFSAEPSVCFMRYGSITLKSAVQRYLLSLLHTLRRFCSLVDFPCESFPFRYELLSYPNYKALYIDPSVHHPFIDPTSRASG